MVITSPREPLTSPTETRRLEVSITFWPLHSNTIRSSCSSSEEMLEYVLSSSTMDIATEVLEILSFSYYGPLFECLLEIDAWNHGRNVFHLLIRRNLCAT